MRRGTLDFGFGTLDFGLWIVDFGFRILDFGKYLWKMSLENASGSHCGKVTVATALWQSHCGKVIALRHFSCLD